MQIDVQQRSPKSVLVKSRTEPGRRFGRLVIIGRPFRIRTDSGAHYQFAVFQCDCESIVARNLKNVTRGHTQSCGCRAVDENKARSTHQLSASRLYRIWRAMVRRCHDQRDKSFADYGAKGVIVCDSWRTNVAEFASWAEANGYADHLTIDRIETSGNYEPSNCRWATWEEQENNRRNNVVIAIGSETKTVSQWSRDQRCAVSSGTVRRRIHSGWEPAAAVFAPANAA